MDGFLQNVYQVFSMLAVEGCQEWSKQYHKKDYCNPSHVYQGLTMLALCALITSLLASYMHDYLKVVNISVYAGSLIRKFVHKFTYNDNYYTFIECSQKSN